MNTESSNPITPSKKTDVLERKATDTALVDSLSGEEEEENEDSPVMDEDGKEEEKEEEESESEEEVSETSDEDENKRSGKRKRECARMSTGGKAPPLPPGYFRC